MVHKLHVNEDDSMRFFFVYIGTDFPDDTMSFAKTHAYRHVYSMNWKHVLIAGTLMWILGVISSNVYCSPLGDLMFGLS